MGRRGVGQVFCKIIDIYIYIYSLISAFFCRFLTMSPQFHNFHNFGSFLHPPPPKSSDQSPSMEHFSPSARRGGHSQPGRMATRASTHTCSKPRGPSPSPRMGTPLTSTFPWRRWCSRRGLRWNPDPCLLWGSRRVGWFRTRVKKKWSLFCYQSPGSRPGWGFHAKRRKLHIKYLKHNIKYYL